MALGPLTLTHSLPLTHPPVHAHTYTHTNSATITAQSKSKEVSNMWGYPVLYFFEEFRGVELGIYFKL